MLKKSFTKVVAVVLIATFAPSCVTNRMTKIPNSTTVSSIEKDRVQILGPAEGVAGGGRLWVLFIPLGWGRDGWCESAAYQGALNSYPNADGLLEQTKTYHRTRVPLLVLTPVFKKVTIKGTAYHIRTDDELAEYLKSKK